MKRILTFCSVLLIAATAFAQAPRYGFESGSYKMETNVMGQTVTSTIYFDDFGAKEATSVSMMGVDWTSPKRSSPRTRSRKSAQKRSTARIVRFTRWR